MMPYLFLLAAAVAMAGVSLIWRRSLARLWLFVVTGGAVSLGDLFVNAIFRLYEYRPGFLAGRADNYLGVVIAECLFVPSYYCLLALVPQRLRLAVNLAAALPMVLLEWVFLHLGVYSHHGWTLWLTATLFGLYGVAAALAVSSVERRGCTGWRRAVFIAGSVYFAMNLWGLVPFGILRLSAIWLHLAANPELDLVLSSLLLHAVPYTLTGLIGVGSRWLRSWHSAGLTAAVWTIWLSILMAEGIWRTVPPWTPALEGVCLAAILHGLARLDQYLGGRS
jgi:hypothetical protein